MEAERNELDQLIDSALAKYADAEPLAGLEQRVLERVRMAESGRRARVWWRWAVAVGVAAGLVLVAVNRPRTVDHKQLVGQAFRPAAGLPPGAPAEIRRQAGRPAPQRQPHIRVQSKGTVLPKRDQFPTPAPLTADERALLTLARLEVQTRTEMRPIEIEPIEIAPLRITEDQ